MERKSSVRTRPCPRSHRTAGSGGCRDKGQCLCVSSQKEQPLSSCITSTGQERPRRALSCSGVTSLSDVCPQPLLSHRFWRDHQVLLSVSKIPSNLQN